MGKLVFVMRTLGGWKIAASITSLVGLFALIWKEVTAPHALILNSSPSRPSWLPSVSLVLTSIGVMVGLVVDYYKASHELGPEGLSAKFDALSDRVCSLEHIANDQMAVAKPDAGNDRGE